MDRINETYDKRIMKQKTQRLLEALAALIISAIIALLFSFLVSVLSTSQVYAQRVPGREGLYRDSVYRRVIGQGSTSLSCYLSYPQGGSSVLRGYGHNAYELGKLGEFIRAALSDTLIYVRSVRVCGYCSVDGNYASNEQLARKRSLGFMQFILSEYPFLRRYGIRADWVGEDWDQLRSLVASSTLNERDEILQIIDQVDIFSGREKLLMDLNGGAPYRMMEQLFFPLLRRVELTVEYDLHRIIEERYRRKLNDREFALLLEQEREKARREEERLLAEQRALKEKWQADSLAVEETARAQQASARESARRADEAAAAAYRRRREAAREASAARTEHRKLYPLWGVKTNLYALAGLTPQGERTTFMPNLEIEYFAFGRWSLSASALYAYWDFAQGEFWGVTSYTLEPRFWFSPTGLCRGLYTGLYARTGDFDIRRSVVESVPTDNRTGTYYEAGASLGYVLPLSRHWYLEAGVSGGYRRVRDKVYDVEQDKHYLVRNQSQSRLRLTDIRLNIGYRLGKKSIK